MRDLERPDPFPEPSPPALREAQRLRALVRLLADDAPAVRATVHRELRRAGSTAMPLLAEAAREDDARLRARSRALLASFERDAALHELRTYARAGVVDLEEGLLRLGRLDRADLDPARYRQVLDTLGREAGARVRRAPEGLSRPIALVRYLAEDVGFTGAEHDVHHPDNVHLHRVLETRTGLPLTLCAVHLFVARRLGVRAGVLPLPGHVLLRLYAGSETVIVDPFRGGRIRPMRECIEYVRAYFGREPSPAWFRDAPDALLLQRQVRNLMHGVGMRGRRREAVELRELALLLDPVVRATGGGWA